MTTPRGYILLTGHPDERQLLLSVRHVASVRPVAHGAIVHTDGLDYAVRQSPAEVAAAITAAQQEGGAA